MVAGSKEGRSRKQNLMCLGVWLMAIAPDSFVPTGTNITLHIVRTCSPKTKCTNIYRADCQVELKSQTSSMS